MAGRLTAKPRASSPTGCGPLRRRSRMARRVASPSAAICACWLACTNGNHRLTITGCQLAVTRYLVADTGKDADRECRAYPVVSDAEAPARFLELMNDGLVSNECPIRRSKCPGGESGPVRQVWKLTTEQLEAIARQGG